jgi:hypothetical protein
VRNPRLEPFLGLSFGVVSGHDLGFDKGSFGVRNAKYYLRKGVFEILFSILSSFQE